MHLERVQIPQNPISDDPWNPGATSPRGASEAAQLQTPSRVTAAVTVPISLCESLGQPWNASASTHGLSFCPLRFLVGFWNILRSARRGYGSRLAGAIPGAAGNPAAGQAARSSISRQVGPLASAA